MELLPVAKKAKTEHHTFFNNERFSDIMLKFGGTEIKAHKVVLCQKSEYFKRAFNGQFKEATEKEMDLGSEDNVSAMLGMLHFIYGMSWVSNSHNSNNDQIGSFIYYYRVFVVADKYDVPSLRKAAAKKAFKRLERPKTTQFMRTLGQVLTSVSADKVMYYHALYWCANNLHWLMKQAAFVGILDKNPAISHALLVDCFKNIGTVDGYYRCHSCQSFVPVDEKYDHEDWGCPLCNCMNKHDYDRAIDGSIWSHDLCGESFREKMMGGNEDTSAGGMKMFEPKDDSKSSESTSVSFFKLDNDSESSGPTGEMLDSQPDIGWRD